RSTATTPTGCHAGTRSSSTRTAPCSRDRSPKRKRSSTPTSMSRPCAGRDTSSTWSGTTPARTSSASTCAEVVRAQDQSEFGHAGLELEDGVDGSRVHVVLHREIATHPVAEVHEVEELREAALAFGLDRQHLVHALVDDLARDLEARREPLVLEAVA